MKTLAAMYSAQLSRILAVSKPKDEPSVAAADNARTGAVSVHANALLPEQRRGRADTWSVLLPTGLAYRIYPQ
ncbi:hypothetical protein PR001_g18701 [Phytophthora rubi]|uniref:Uncharacterized protein n=1 Tax=Phytophthora rubi TaxID=129364 RepID=A0A6A3K0Y2_9STRA|nr:hypothetical protein PR001_g18701 [Phytophthora rubi]